MTQGVAAYQVAFGRKTNMPRFFIVEVWDNVHGFFHTITNGNDPYGRFTRKEAEKEAAYWRSCGFEAVLQACES